MLKGNGYVEVNERIKAFRKLFPTGSIETNIENLDNGIVVMSCTVKDSVGNILSKAHAYEKEGSTFINKTSYIENCCTSATGRALGYLGIGIDTSVASAEEVQNAIIQQDAEKEITKVQEEALREVIKKSGTDDQFVIGYLEENGYKRLSDIKIKDYMKIVNHFRKE